jgi:hypothetical protein
MAATSDRRTTSRSLPVVELRQYLLRPQRRDELIELFDRELVEPQEAVGMTVMGQFRDLDRADHFVWLRGFSDMAARHRALTDFYGGPVWAEHGAAAGATMIDSDDVLLLRPVTPAAALRLGPAATRGAGGERGAILVVIVHRDPAAGAERGAAQLAATVGRLLDRLGARQIGAYETEPAPNTFHRLPIRDVDVAVWFGGVDAVDRLTDGQAEIERLIAGADLDVEVLTLVPTARSLLRGTDPDSLSSS